LPSLGKSREAFTAASSPPTAFYLSLASDAADEARKNITTVEQTIPVMIDLAENNLQRTALTALAQRAAAFRDGLKTLSEQFATRTNLLKTAIDDNQAAMIAVINKLSAQMTLRELQAQGSFDHTLADIYQNVALVAVIFLTLIVGIGVLIARSIIQPLKEIMAAMHAVVSEKYDDPIHGTTRATRSARWRGRSRCFAKMPSPSARRRTSCGPRRSAPSRRSRTCARRSKT
jgi:HAMP domain.